MFEIHEYGLNRMGSIKLYRKLSLHNIDIHIGVLNVCVHAELLNQAWNISIQFNKKIKMGLSWTHVHGEIVVKNFYLILAKENEIQLFTHLKFMRITNTNLK